MAETSKISLAYAAGFIDGDGSILVSKQRRSHNAFVYATGTDVPTLEMFRVSFGGSLRVQSDKRNINWKPHGIWRKSIPSSGSFLVDLEPHLFLKRKQANLALSLVRRKQSETRDFKGWRYGCAGMPDVEQAERNAIASAISALNAQSCNCPHEGVPPLEYFAGFFDAEGCVGVYKPKHKKNYRMLHVNVTNRCRWILEQYQSLFGGSVSAGHGAWQWQCHCRIAQRFLRQIAPFLHVKKERVLEGLSIYDHSGINNGWPLRSSEDYSSIAVIANNMAAHNRKGVAEDYPYGE